MPISGSELANLTASFGGGVMRGRRQRFEDDVAQQEREEGRRRADRQFGLQDSQLQRLVEQLQLERDKFEASRQPKPILRPWEEEGFPDEQSFLDFQTKNAAATRAPTAPRAPLRGQVVQSETGEFVTVDPTEMGPTGVRGRLPTAGGENDRLQAAQQTKREGLNAGLQLVQSVREEVKARPQSFGIKNVLPRMIRNRPIPGLGDPEGVAPRSLLEGLVGEIRHTRFGGALTATEAAYALRFLPDEDDPAQAILDKLDALEQYLNGKLGVIGQGGPPTGPGLRQPQGRQPQGFEPPPE